MSIELIQNGQSLGAVKHKTFEKLAKEFELVRRRTGISVDAYGTHVLQPNAVKLIHDALVSRAEHDVVAFRKLLAEALQRNAPVVLEGD